jgi:hypothetical protein
MTFINIYMANCIAEDEFIMKHKCFILDFLTKVMKSQNSDNEVYFIACETARGLISRFDFRWFMLKEMNDICFEMNIDNADDGVVHGLYDLIYAMSLNRGFQYDALERKVLDQILIEMEKRVKDKEFVLSVMGILKNFVMGYHSQDGVKYLKEHSFFRSFIRHVHDLYGTDIEIISEVNSTFRFML